MPEAPGVPSEPAMPAEPVAPEAPASDETGMGSSDVPPAGGSL
jgi:hypothetical protein